ncbi:MAG TPA: nitroreductase family protein, partial [Bacillota bacterium]|nr:nitroreductase family protein [Bacillota bacterium]
MDVIDAINRRRSIRKFKTEPLPDEVVRTILESAIKAPSGKNRQPWEFVVVQGDRKEEMLQVMNRGIMQVEDEGEAKYIKYTLEIMKQAPVTVFVFNPNGTNPWLKKSVEQ